MKKFISILIATVMLLLSVGIVSAAETGEEINLTRMNGNFFTAGSADPAYDASKAFDGVSSLDSRWATPANTDDEWLQVTFIDKVTVTAFQIDECKDWGSALDFEIQALVDGAWATVYEGTEIINEKIALSQPVDTTDIRLFVNAHSNTIFGTTIYEMVVFGYAEERTLLTKEHSFTATASTFESDVYAASAAFDGVVGSLPNCESRWAAVANDVNSWVEVTFDQEVSLSSFNIIECTVWANVESYNIQVFQNGEYVTVHTGEKINGAVKLDQVYTTTKIKFNCLSIAEGRYPAITLYEIQYFGPTQSEITPPAGGDQPGENENPIPNPPTGDMNYVILVLVAVAVVTAYGVSKKRMTNI